MTGKRMTSDGGDALNLHKKHKISSQDQPLDYIFSSAASNSFVGSRAMLSFGVNRVNQEEIGDDYLDEYLNQPEKKRRLSFEQVQFLEQKFEIDNKLEPDRKIKLAKELGLQPRQIAVWFQNRRARWKTKTLETDYETLHADYESLKTNYDSLLKENEKLKTEVLHLKGNGLATEIDLDSFNKKQVLSESMPKESNADMNSEDGESKEDSAVVSKNDEHSDLTDADSPHLVDTIHSSQLFEPNLSYLSHDGEDNLHPDLLLPAYIIPKMGDAHLLQPASSCYYTFPVEDQPFNFWSY